MQIEWAITAFPSSCLVYLVGRRWYLINSFWLCHFFFSPLPLQLLFCLLPIVVAKPCTHKAMTSHLKIMVIFMTSLHQVSWFSFSTSLTKPPFYRLRTGHLYIFHYFSSSHLDSLIVFYTLSAKQLPTTLFSCFFPKGLYWRLLLINRVSHYTWDPCDSTNVYFFIYFYSFIYFFFFPDLKIVYYNNY